MVRIAGWNDPLLGRPFALYDVVRDSSGQAVAVDFVYLVGGKLTTALARMQPGQMVEVWGPLGNGFPADTELRRAHHGCRRHRPNPVLRLRQSNNLAPPLAA